MKLKTAYVDSRGWVYAVREGLGESTYKARYWKPGQLTSGKCVARLSWRHFEADAQADLDAYARRHAMNIYRGRMPWERK